MINLEQVKLLEARVAKTIEYVERLSKENAALNRQEAELQARLEASQKRIDEFELLELDLQAKLESYQKRIDELEVLITGFKEDQGQIEEGILAALDRLSQFEKAMEKTLKDKPAVTKRAAKSQAPEEAANASEGQTCFEIPEGADADDASDNDIPDPVEGGELDIF